MTILEEQEKRAAIIKNLKKAGVETVNGKKLDDCTALEIFAINLHVKHQLEQAINKNRQGESNGFN